MKKKCLFEKHLDTIKSNSKQNFNFTSSSIKTQNSSTFNPQVISTKHATNRKNLSPQHSTSSKLCFSSIMSPKFSPSPMKKIGTLPSSKSGYMIKDLELDNKTKEKIPPLTSHAAKNKNFTQSALDGGNYYGSFKVERTPSKDVSRRRMILSPFNSKPKEGEITMLKLGGKKDKKSHNLNSVDYSKKYLEKTANEYLKLSMKKMDFLNNKESNVNKRLSERETINDTGNELLLMTVSSNGSTRRPIQKSMSIPKKKRASSQGKSLQAEIDLLFGKRPKQQKTDDKPNEQQEDNKNRQSLLSKISKAVTKSYNIFTKVNLFEEAETDEFDNPTYREYMEDRVICEYCTSIHKAAALKAIANNQVNEDKSNKDQKSQNMKIDLSFINNDNKKTDSKTNKPANQINSQHRSKSRTSSNQDLFVINEEIENLADSLIESSMYGGNDAFISQSTPNNANSISPNNKKIGMKKANSINTAKNEKSSEPNAPSTSVIGPTNSANSNRITIFGILDGHGGYTVSTKGKELMAKEIHSKINMSTNENLVKTLLTECFEKVDKELMTKITECDDMGSTCTISFIMKTKTNRILYVANVGDSHAYLVSNKKATRLTSEHKCDNLEEVERLKEKNAMIFQNRMFGQLALTRALCDRKLKPYGLSATPAITSTVIKEVMMNSETENQQSDTEYDMYLIVASDGIWDVTKEEDLMRIFVHERKQQTTKELCKTLLDFSIKNGSTDNISLIVVKL